MAERHLTGMDKALAGPDTEQSLEAVQKPASSRRRSHGPVDAAVGVGHPLMPAEHVTRGLVRIAAKGVRTAKVLDLGGVPCVMTKALPRGVHAVMLADRIEAVRTATGAVVATVPRDVSSATMPAPRRVIPNNGQGAVCPL